MYLDLREKYNWCLSYNKNGLILLSTSNSFPTECHLSADLLRQLHLHPLHGDASQQGVLLWEQPDEGPDRADAAQLRDAAGPHLHAAARPLHPAAQSVTGQLAVSSARCVADSVLDPCISITYSAVASFYSHTCHAKTTHAAELYRNVF